MEVRGFKFPPGLERTAALWLLLLASGHNNLFTWGVLWFIC